MIAKRRIALTHETLVTSNGATKWVAKGILWCRLTPRLGRLRLLAGVEEQNITHLVRLRFTPSVQAGDRLKGTHQQLLVHSVCDPDGRQRRLECLCEQRSATEIEVE